MKNKNKALERYEKADFKIRGFFNFLEKLHKAGEPVPNKFLELKKKKDKE